VKIMNQKNADLNKVMTKASNKAQAALAKLQVPAKSTAKETAPNAVKTAPQPAAPIPA
jgi:hypothetical protein